MIIDKLANAGTYTGLHRNFGLAFDYLQAQDLETLETGTYQVAEGVKVILTDNEAKTEETSLQKFECHNKNIDIQVCIRGDEIFGWKPRNDCKNIKIEYSDEKDVMFYDEQPSTFFTLKPGQFVILYPNDVHAAMIGEGMIKKLVIKVAV